MRRKKTDIYIIPNTDPHLGEYIPSHWQIIKWLTGFTGSAATVVITDKFAGLWTDSRYFLQAEVQLRDTGFHFMRPETGKAPDYIEWTGENCSKDTRVGLDGRIFSVSKYRKLEKIIKGKGARLNHKADLVSSIWDDRPLMPFSIAFEHEIKYCGTDRVEKIRIVRERMEREGIDYNLLTSPDDIMWMLNIRGSDIEFSPLLLSFALTGKDQVLLFIDEKKLTYKSASQLDKSGIVVLPYEETGALLSSLPDGSVLLLDPDRTSVSLQKSIPRGVKITEGVSIPSMMKSVKNRTEVANIANAMIKDGVALIRFFHWLEENSGKIKMSEVSLAEKLREYRSVQDGFLGLSFATITAFNEHSALPHYSPSHETDSKIEGNGILLIDSGGQYLDGTTDITRTVVLGRPTDQQKRDFTFVLKGMIALSNARFPSQTKGIQLDTLARKYLWEAGLDYGHGTGHGVGYCLNVHEGPVSISGAASSGSRSCIEAGMLLSDEPAVYREGEYGIRIENLLLSYEDEESEFGRFLRFETMSLCHIDKKLIDKTLLDDQEVKWLDDYHSEVYSKLSPFLLQEEKLWLQEKCEPI
jgi:Xaa-Pro aminopeptidase